MHGSVLSLRSRVRGISRRREVVGRLVGTHLKLKYEASTLGYFWSILEPLLLTGVYFFVLRGILGFGRGLNYPLFLLTGILPWHWLTNTVNGSVRALGGNANLIGKVYVPREVFPISVVVARIIEYGLSLGVLVLFAVIYRQTPSVYLAALPLAVLLQTILLTGLAFILAPANTLLRDIERLLRPLLRAAFYLTPILYPMTEVLASGVPDILKTLYRLNPLVGIFELYHAVFYPDLFVSWNDVAISAVGSVSILVIGWTMFRRLERSVLKEL